MKFVDKGTALRPVSQHIELAVWGERRQEGETQKIDDLLRSLSVH